MDRALTDCIEQQVKQAFPEGAIARVQVLQYGDEPEVEPGQAAMRVFFEWPGRSAGGQADPKTVHRFVTANAAALGGLRDDLPGVIEWVEFCPEGEARGGQPPSPGLQDHRPRKVGPHTRRSAGRPHSCDGPARGRRSGDRGHPDHRGRRQQPGRRPALGIESPPGTPGLRSAPAAAHQNDELKTR